MILRHCADRARDVMAMVDSSSRIGWESRDIRESGVTAAWKLSCWALSTPTWSHQNTSTNTVSTAKYNWPQILLRCPPEKARTTINFSWTKSEFKSNLFTCLLTSRQIFVQIWMLNLQLRKRQSRLWTPYRVICSLGWTLRSPPRRSQFTPLFVFGLRARNFEPTTNLSALTHVAIKGPSLGTGLTLT